jgi:TonB-linked SusC/RagA family outer membrane protein
MRTKFSGFLTLLLALIVQISFAQEKTISGTVTDQAGLPLPGVNIVVQGTTTGTQTDFDGNYTIKASVGQVLVYTYVGQKTAQRTVGASNTINLQMEEDAQALEEVIVTAQGIKREKQALGYAIAEVSSEQLEQRAEGDVGRVLNGKASGVQITAQSGISGSGTNIIIRGLSSFSGSNQPLFIVDGVPFNSDTNTAGAGDGDTDGANDFINGNLGSSRFFDLDPNNIESINVLKGLAAATLYGTAGRNGVILITTKNGATGGGKKKSEVTLTSSVFFNEIASLPDYQDSYGNGFDQSFGWFFSNWGPSFERDGVAGWGNSASFDENGTLAHPYSTAGASTGIPQAFPEFANARYEWKPYNSVENFFRTGVAKTTAINFKGNSDDGKVSYNMNFSHLDDEGFTPENKVIRNTFGMGGKAELTNNFTISGTINYARTDFRSPPVAAGDGNTVFGAIGNFSGSTGSSVFSNVFFTPRSVDLIGLPFQNPITGASVYYRQNNSIQHPLWTVNNAKVQQVTNRVFGNGTIQYKFNDNLNFLYRLGVDVASTNNINQQNKGGVSDDTTTRSGVYQTWNDTNIIWDHNFILNGQYDITDKIGVSFNLGATTRREILDRTGVRSSGQQIFDVFRHFNFAIQDELQFSSERNIVGVYGQAEFDYDRWLYVTVAGRNDWVSNLAVENRSIFYPSASFSFVPTSIIDGLRNNDYINYLKIRGGYGTSANFPTGFPVASRLALDTRRFLDDAGNAIVSNTTSEFVENPNLKPERLDEIEIGIESRFFKNRVTLDASYYTRITKDLIVDQDLGASSGFLTTQTNVGEIESNGFEVDLGVNIFRSSEEGELNWDINANWTTNDVVVNDLGANDTQILVYAGINGLAANAAIEGESLGSIVGSRILRDDEGNFVVNSQGNYIIEEGNFIIGDAIPDWNLNISNTLSYKNFNFSFLFTYVHGGDIYSQTIATLLGRGLTTDTEDRENTFILPGVQENGDPNNVQINNSGYYFDNVLFGPAELNIYDGSVIRLQEISLGYSVPSKFLDKTPFGSLSFTVSGFNLWYDAINTPDGVNFDPNVAGAGVGNAAGFDFLNGPSSRRYGFSLKATF